LTLGAALQPREAHASTTPPTLDEATWAARVAALGRELDADDDGRIGKAELEAHFLRKEATAWGRVKEFWYVSQLTRQVLFSFSC
jgi:hypothetical protein